VHVRAVAAVAPQELAQVHGRVTGVDEALGRFLRQAQRPPSQVGQKPHRGKVYRGERLFARFAQAVLAQELAEVLAVDLGGTRRGGEVALVALELRAQVLALERVDDLRLGLLERGGRC
jgi:hypothetical protein